MRYDEIKLPPGWSKVMKGYRRVDGAEVHIALRAKVAGWYVQEPGQTNFLRDVRGDLKRWKRAEAAMHYLDTKYPLPLTEDAGDTMTLYHGCSDIMRDRIARNGLAPFNDLKAFCLDTLSHYLPKEEWTDELLERIDQRCARPNGGGLFFTTSPKTAEGYAKANAKHGGEIAHDVYTTAAVHLAGPDVTWKEFQANPPISPRYSEAGGIVVEVEVPKDWVHRHGHEFHIRQTIPPEMIKSIRNV